MLNLIVVNLAQRAVTVQQRAGHRQGIVVVYFTFLKFPKTGVEILYKIVFYIPDMI